MFPKSHRNSFCIDPFAPYAAFRGPRLAGIAGGRCLRLTTWLVAAATLVAISAGCTPKQYAQQADKSADKVLAQNSGSRWG